MEINAEAKQKKNPLQQNPFAIAGVSIGLIAVILFFVQHNVGDMIDILFSKTEEQQDLPVTKAMGGVSLILGFVSIFLKEKKQLAGIAIALGASALMIELFLVAIVIIILLGLASLFME